VAIAATVSPGLESLDHGQEEMRTEMNQMKNEMRQMNGTLQSVLRDISTLAHESKQPSAANPMWRIAQSDHRLCEMMMIALEEHRAEVQSIFEPGQTEE
jgi:hypothetical protein